MGALSFSSASDFSVCLFVIVIVIALVLVLRDRACATAGPEHGTPCSYRQRVLPSVNCSTRRSDTISPRKSAELASRLHAEVI